MMFLIIETLTQILELENVDQLIKKSHKNNIKVIIDQVLSHTSDQHPFFILSRSNKTNPKKDWYVWADAKSDGSPPNNWLSILGSAGMGYIKETVLFT